MSGTVCRGIRGATTADANTKEAIVSATRELLEAVVSANGIVEVQVAAVFFTTTRDLNAEFPAVAARQMGWTSTALICGHEMDVPDAATSVVRVLMLVNTDKSPDRLVNVYLKEAKNLRSRGTETWRGQ
ncbi:MAG: chorismate mutase [Chloroflexi bacterium]|nr:chorismate mutase [Chloroflexota bacterium]